MPKRPDRPQPTKEGERAGSGKSEAEGAANTGTKTTTTEETDLERVSKESYEAQIAYFRSIPWCAAHLEATERLSIVQPISRTLSLGPPVPHGLISRTLNTPSIIPAYVVFFTEPGGGDGSDALVAEVKAFFALGPMLNGWPGFCHGGIVCMMMDEIMGAVVEVNRHKGLMSAGSVVTSRLTIRFLKPVRTGTTEEPNVVLVRGRLAEVNGRKFILRATAEGEGGELLPEGESLFVEIRPRL
ncbi:hypothetical protein VTG60DRAFT_2143 [Thermothelomyces hinnuleus]